MKIAATNINAAGIEVSKSRMAKLTEKYIKQYSQMSDRLYDLGYLSNPGYFYEDEFWTTFFEENPDYTSKFLNRRTGSMNYTVNQLKYILKTEEYADTYRVLETVMKVYEAQKALNEFSEFCRAVKFKKRDDRLHCKASFTVSYDVHNSGKIPLDGEYINKCFCFNDYKIIKVNYGEVLLREFLKELGVDGISGRESVLLGENFTIDDDVEFLREIVDGDIEGAGKYAGLLHNRVEKYYEDYYASRTTRAECRSYFERGFTNAVPACVEYINKFRKTNNLKEVYVTSSEVWFVTDEKGEIPVKQPLRDIYVGRYLCDYRTREDLGAYNRLLGYEGEFINEADLEYYPDVAGMPVEFTYLERKRTRTVPVPVKYHTILNDRYLMPRKPVTYRTVEGMMEQLGIDSLDTLDTEAAGVVQRVYDVNPRGFKLLVGKMFRTLICILCDYTPAGCESPNHLRLNETFDWVTEEIYEDACMEAESLYKKFGF